MRKLALAVLASLALAGCYDDLGPVVTEVRTAPDGHLVMRRCELYVASWGASGGDMRDCHTGPVPAPSSSSSAGASATR